MPTDMLPGFIESLCRLRDYYVKYKVMNYHIQHENSLALKLIYTKNILRFSNAGWDHSSFHYDKKTKELEIDTHLLNHYGFSFRDPRTKQLIIQSIFSYLPVSTFSVKNVRHLNTIFWSTKCRTMDISQAKTTPSSHFLKYFKAKELLVNQLQYKKVSAFENPHKVKIVIAAN